MEFKVDKFYKTRQGLKVRIYHNSPDNFPNLHGAYEQDGKWKVASWNWDGKYGLLLPNSTSVMDIVQEWDSIFNIDESSYKAWHSEMPITPKSSKEWLAAVNQALRDSLIYGTGIINVQDCVDITRPVSPDDIFITETKNAIDEAAHELLEIAADYGRSRTIPIAKDIIDVENERLYNDMDCKVDNYQDHQAHILRHKDFFLNRQPTSAYYSHIQEHIDALTNSTKTQTHILNGSLAAIMPPIVQRCSCTGPLHENTCKAYEAANVYNIEPGEDYPLGMLDLYAPEENKVVKCECGAESVGSSRHSEWCNKYQEF